MENQFEMYKNDVIKNLINNYEGKTIIVGTHGNVMTIIMNYFNKAYGDMSFGRTRLN